MQVIGLFGDSKHPGMVYHSRPEDDPYITQQGDSDSDRGDFVLKGTDRLILAARNEDDVSHLEVQRPSLRTEVPELWRQQRSLEDEPYIASQGNLELRSFRSCS